MKAMFMILTLFVLISCGDNQKMKFQTTDSENVSGDISSFDAQPGKSYTGIDYQGRQRTCQQIDTSQILCTNEMTASDQFAKNCYDSGNLAVRCACHDWICIQK